MNGQPITERDLRITAQFMGDQLTQYPEENWREIVIQVAIESRLIAMAAEAEALDEDVNFLTEMALLRERLLRRILSSNSWFRWSPKTTSTPRIRLRSPEWIFRKRF